MWKRKSRMEANNRAVKSRQVKRAKEYAKANTAEEKIASLRCFGCILIGEQKCIRDIKKWKNNRSVTKWKKRNLSPQVEADHSATGWLITNAKTVKNWNGFLLIPNSVAAPTGAPPSCREQCRLGQMFCVMFLVLQNLFMTRKATMFVYIIWLFQFQIYCTSLKQSFCTLFIFRISDLLVFFPLHCQSSILSVSGTLISSSRSPVMENVKHS